MADETLWMRDLTGNKAFIPAADRDRWTAHGWAETVPPAHGEFVWMAKDDLIHPGLIPWGARDYWQGIGFRPSPPPEPVNPTRDPALTSARVQESGPPDGTVDEVLAWVGNDRQRAEQARAAEQQRDKPRTTLVDALGKAGQPEQDTSAAPAAPKIEE